jgi:uncharacterized protein (TIGR00295 family)
MGFIDEKKAVNLLRRYSTSERDFRSVLAHSRKVQEIALGLATGIRGVDLEFIKTASLLHDIGRFKCPPWKNSVRHGVEGAMILRRNGLENYALVAERHLGAGITKEDITTQGLALPRKDFVPRSIEEKIITIADKLADGNKRISLFKAAERFKKEISPRAAVRIIALYKEVKGLKSGGYRHREVKGRTDKTRKKNSHKR